MFEQLAKTCDEEKEKLKEKILEYYGKLRKKAALIENLEFDKIIAISNQGISLSLKSNILREHSNKICPELKVALKKYNIVNSIQNILLDTTSSPAEKLVKLDEMLKEENKKDLKEPYAKSFFSKTKGEKFLNEVLSGCEQIRKNLVSKKSSAALT